MNKQKSIDGMTLSHPVVKQSKKVSVSATYDRLMEWLVGFTATVARATLALYGLVVVLRRLEWRFELVLGVALFTLVLVSYMSNRFLKRIK